MLKFFLIFMVANIWGCVDQQNPRDMFEVTGDPDEIYSTISPLIETIISDRSNLAGVGVGVVNAKGRWVFGFGNQAPDQIMHPPGKSYYELGGITKVFTGLLLALAHSEDKVDLDGDVESCDKQAEKMPCKKLTSLTWRKVAVHHGGLSAVPNNLGFGDDALRTYRPEDLSEYLKNILPNEVGEGDTKFEDSFVGYAMIAAQLEEQYQLSYEKMLDDKIVSPLGIYATRVQLTSSERERLVIGADKNGLVTERYIDSGLGLVGGHGLYSTLDDLNIVLAAHMSEFESSLKETIEVAIKPNEKFSGETANSKMGFSWQILNSGAIWHSGYGAMHTGILIFDPEAKIGVSVFAGEAMPRGIIENLGIKVLNRLLHQRKRK